MKRKDLLRYVGGKNAMAEWIIDQFPHHRCYVELFGGGASVLIQKPRSAVEVYNDKWDAVVTFFKVLRDQCEALQNYVEHMPYSRSLRNKLQEKMEKDAFESDVAKAGTFFFLNRSGFDGEIYGSFSFTKQVENNKAKTLYKKARQLHLFNERFKGVYIENLDFTEAIEKYDGEDTFFYCDPPYLERNHYVLDFDKRDHIRLGKRLKQVEGKVMLSYYPHTLLQSLYPKDEWFRVEKQSVLYSQKKKKELGQTKDTSTEMLLMNYNPKKNTWKKRKNKEIEDFF